MLTEGFVSVEMFFRGGGRRHRLGFHDGDVPSDILVIEDDLGISRVGSLYPERDRRRLAAAGQGISGWRVDRWLDHGLIAPDLMLPRRHGKETCRFLRGEPTVPTIMAAAWVGEKNRPIGLDLDVQDYILKPFSPREPAAGARRAPRRTARQMDASEGSLLPSGWLTIDLKNWTVNGGEASIPTTITEPGMFLCIEHKN